MAFDTFIDINGVEGEATADGFTGKIEISSFSWGASNSVTVGSGSTGLVGGKTSVSSFSFTKRMESSSNVLFSACTTGKHFSTAKVSMRKSGGSDDNPQQVFMEFDFTDIMVESIQWSGSGGGDDTPTESITMAFASVTLSYKAQVTDTGAGDSKAIKAGWDNTKVKKASAA
jgi:type VI secretion system secreted protein Hcp